MSSPSLSSPAISVNPYSYSQTQLPKMDPRDTRVQLADMWFAHKPLFHFAIHHMFTVLSPYPRKVYSNTRQWRSQKFSTGVRQSVAFISVHSHSAALPSRPYNQKNVMTYHTARNHIPKNYLFSWQGVRTPLTLLVWLRHWYKNNDMWLT